jgi:hypothetical protein
LARAEGRNSTAKAAITTGIVRQRTLVLKYLTPIDVLPDDPIGPVYRRPGSYPWTPRGNMNASDTGCGEEVFRE